MATILFIKNLRFLIELKIQPKSEKLKLANLPKTVCPAVGSDVTLNDS